MSNNIEVEARFRVADEHALLKKLKDFGAKNIGAVVIEDHNFSMDRRDFWKSIEALRIRTESNKSGGMLTYKPSGNKSQRVMTTKEYEVSIDDPFALMQIFKHIGIIPLKYLEYIKRTRRKYKYGVFNIVIDEYHELGPFIEIERIVSGKGNVSRAQREIESLAIKLGLTESDRQTVPVGFLLKEKHMKGVRNAK
ncbi:class IV adenylate cyclase [Candidatus Marsarchaeota archaeon]|nr:class IV adenylate cyclase [Candidatus Marsarchaeota archaeon]MCL5404703.1 class IV adenylate cyclase [Candidatus Marsarchaeota archaeon]